MPLNQCNFIGRLTADPEIRHTSSGKAVCGFSIAVQKEFVQEGEPDAEFIRCVAWEGKADFLAKWGYKGARWRVSGRYGTRKWTDNNDIERESVEITVTDFDPIDWPEDSQGSQRGQGSRGSQRGQGSRGGGGNRGGGYGGGNRGGGGQRQNRSAPPQEDEYDPFADE